MRAAEPAEFERIGGLTAGAYLAGDLIPPGSDYEGTLRDTATRAAHCEVLVAVDAETGALLGTVSYVRAGSRYAEVSTDGEAEFRMLAVDVAAQGRGVGRRLVLECLERARAERATRLVLCTLAVMSAARALYTSLGFTRSPGRDWEPVPGIELLGYELALD